MIFRFGKFKGHDINDVCNRHPAYVYALLNNTMDGEFSETVFFQHLLNTWKNCSPNIPFGKHCGRQICTLPEQYLNYLYPKLEDGWLKDKISDCL